MSEAINILWFRNGLRFHDNGSLHNAVHDGQTAVLPLFIWDGETPVTRTCGYNKIAFLLECLEDLDNQLREVGSKLYCIRGSPVEVLRRISKVFKIQKVCFDQDCEPIWIDRDNAVKNFCGSHKIAVCENIGATLWNPEEIIEANHGIPPLTYKEFCLVTEGMGPPERPKEDIDLSKVNWLNLDEIQSEKLHALDSIPTPEHLGFKYNGEKKVYKGGERRALKFFCRRIEHEKEAFLDGSFLPNRQNPDILNPPKSLSPDLKFGCLSVRLFYWEILDAFREVHEGNPPPSNTIISQLIWREFFYVMSVNNPFFGEISRNPVCINVPWYNDNKNLEKFLMGETGYPFIDAGVTQLKREGWTHHVVRNALSMFLTRGDLWESWVPGLMFFMEYQIDADWAVCSGNWMWVSSSAFENTLNFKTSIDPRVYGRRFDPYGSYIKRFVPALKDMPVEYVYAPWKAPLEVQEKAGCIIGKDYTAPMVDHDIAVRKNTAMMEVLQKNIMKLLNEEPNHVHPSNTSEINSFFRI